MSKLSKFSMLFAGLFAVSVVVIRFILNGWVGWMWFPLGAAIGLFVFAVARDWRLILEFLTLKTTKHGMNMGALIAGMLVFLFAINFLAVTKERRWDFTSEGLNSLSEQSVKVAENLKVDTDFVFLYRRGQNDETVRRQVTELVDRYMQVSPKVHLKVYDVLERPDLAQKFDYTSGAYAFFLSQGGQAPRHMKIEAPTEEEVTRTLIKFAREKKKVVYFVSGHGEHDIAAAGPESISQFKTDLETVYDVKKLELSKETKVPADADVVVIAGPRQAFVKAEIEALRDYAIRGGRMFIALDPDGQHGLASFVKQFGIEYQNNFVLDDRTTAGNIGVLAHDFSLSADATKPLREGFGVFLLASSLKKAPDVQKDFVLDEIVKTDGRPIATDKLTEDRKVQIPGPHTLAILSKGKLSGSEKEFEVIVLGDSDFFRDTLFRANLNRDLAMNLVASLAKDTDLVSIRPKVPKGSKLEMTEQQLKVILFGFLIPLPILLFFTSGLLWWRRRAA